MTLQNPPPTLERDRTKHKYSKTFKEMIDSCLQKDPTKRYASACYSNYVFSTSFRCLFLSSNSSIVYHMYRPTAEKLLQHAFFKQAKKPSFLVTTLLEKLPPLEARIKAKVKRQAEECIQDELAWDFAESGLPNAPSVLPPSIGTHRSTLVDAQECETRKGRFILETSHPSRPASVYSEVASASNSQDNVHQLTTAILTDEGEVKKGRFSVRGQKDSPYLEKDTDSNGNSGDEKHQRLRLPLSHADPTDSRSSSRSDHVSIHPNDESGQTAEEKRGRFQVFADSTSNPRTEPGKFSIQELQDQIASLLSIHDQQRLLLQDLTSKLEQCSIERATASCSFEKQLGALRRDYEEMKKDNERLRVLTSKLP